MAFCTCHLILSRAAEPLLFANISFRSAVFCEVSIRLEDRIITPYHVRNWLIWTAHIGLEKTKMRIIWFRFLWSNCALCLFDAFAVHMPWMSNVDSHIRIQEKCACVVAEYSFILFIYHSDFIVAFYYLLWLILSDWLMFDWELIHVATAAVAVIVLLLLLWMESFVIEFEIVLERNALKIVSSIHCSHVSAHDIYSGRHSLIRWLTEPIEKYTVPVFIWMVKWWMRFHHTLSGNWSALVSIVLISIVVVPANRAVSFST